MPKPHGGKLVERLSPVSKIEELAVEARELYEVKVSHELRLDFENIAYGLYSPLKGPVTQNDYMSILDKGRLSTDIPWTIPIILDVSQESSDNFSEGDKISI